MPTRWDELKTTVQMIIEIAVCFDSDGIDIYFLNRPPLRNISSADDPRLQAAFAHPPQGTTPLTNAVRAIVAEKSGCEKPVLMVIATDGVPDGGPQYFMKTVTDIIHRRITSGIFKFQIMACTEDDSSVAWLNEFDEAFAEVDVTDDYWSERKEVLRTGRYKEFRRSDWII
eukprot:Sspe_Gene.113231::Locus_97198_Transcript_1_1_Confidence_1.000_Length_511::g.113231::m.113231